MSIRERLLNILPIFILICVIALLFWCSINVNINTDTETTNEATNKKAVACYGCSHYDADTNSCIEWDDWSNWCEAGFPTDTLEEWLNQWAVDQEWIPWQVNEEWTAQVIPEFEVTAESHENFKNFINRFNSNVKPWDVWNVEHFYWIKEWVIACIAFAETSMWTRGYWLCNNVGNVGNNDRGNRHCYATVQWGLEAMWQTLNNWNLWDKQTIGCLSKAGHCTETWDNGKIRASSTSSRENNVVNCLEAIYQQEIDPSTFIFRK
jgi:hypothetical protein